MPTKRLLAFIEAERQIAETQLGAKQALDRLIAAHESVYVTVPDEPNGEAVPQPESVQAKPTLAETQTPTSFPAEPVNEAAVIQVQQQPATVDQAIAQDRAFSQSEDYRTISFNGETHEGLAPGIANFIKTLYEAWLRGDPDVQPDQLPKTRPRDIFKPGGKLSPLFGTLVVPGTKRHPGTKKQSWRLNPDIVGAAPPAPCDPHGGPR